MEEIWKDIPGYEGFYQVSNLGRVKSLSRKVTSINEKWWRVRPDTIMKPQLSKGGYPQVSFVKNNGKRKSFRIHRLVMLSFVPNPENKPCINHINGIKTDNSLENLEWCTISENNKHASDNGLRVYNRGEDHHFAKLSEEDVIEIRRLRDEDGLTYKKIAEMYNVEKSLPRLIHRRKIWKHI